MKPEAIQAEIKKLSIKKYGKNSKVFNRMNNAIMRTSERLAPLLEQRGLQITTHGTAHGGDKSNCVYLEKRGNTNHDMRTKAYRANVLAAWEWKVQRGKYYNPIAATSIIEFCTSLTWSVKAFSA